jgi:hypothetical protein
MDIFSPCVFNNIVEHTLFFHSPGIAPKPCQSTNKAIFFNDLQIFEFPAYTR